MKKSMFFAIVGAFLFMALPWNASAQHELPSNELMYHSFRMPQSNQLNPAFFPRNNTFYFTFPRFNFSFGFPLSYNEIGLNYNKQTDKTELDMFQLIDKMSDNNQLNFDLNIDLIGFGFRVNRMFFTFGSSFALNANLTLPKDAFDALTDNSKSLIGRDNAMVLASDDFITLNSYLRYSIGGGYEFEQIPLTVGGHINILNGIVNVNTDQTDVRLYATDAYYSKLIASVDYQIQSAGIASYKSDEFSFDGSPSSYGFTFDLGAQYAYDNFLFSASLVDVGPGIHWKQNVVTHQSKGSTLTFDGVDITTLITNGHFDTSFAQAFRDSLTNIYEIVDNEGGDFWFSVPTKINLGASYTFANEMLRAGFLFHGQWDKGLFSHGYTNRFRFNTTLSLTANLKDWIEVMFGNSLVFDSHRTDLFNPGFGIVLSPGKAVQLYTMVDYLSSFYMADCKSFNLSMGMNVMIGNTSNKAMEETPSVQLEESTTDPSTEEPVSETPTEEPVY